jgi:pimeloyl-ACP methyl ester carboxylesterase
MSQPAIKLSDFRRFRAPNAKLTTAKYTASVIPGARLSVYEGIGHSPFYEDAPRFNAELAAFVREANRIN